MSNQRVSSISLCLFICRFICSQNCNQVLHILHPHVMSSLHALSNFFEIKGRLTSGPHRRGGWVWRQSHPHILGYLPFYLLGVQLQHEALDREHHSSASLASNCHALFPMELFYFCFTEQTTEAENGSILTWLAVGWAGVQSQVVRVRPQSPPCKHCADALHLIWGSWQDPLTTVSRSLWPPNCAANGNAPYTLCQKL